MLIKGDESKIYDNERIPPTSCGGLFGAPMPYEYITSETEIRVSLSFVKKCYLFGPSIE